MMRSFPARKDLKGVAFFQRETILENVTMSAKFFSPYFPFRGEMCPSAAMRDPRRLRGFLGLIFMP